MRPFRTVIKMKLRLRLRIFDKIEIRIPSVAKLTVYYEKCQDDNNNKNNNNKLNCKAPIAKLSESYI